MKNYALKFPENTTRKYEGKLTYLELRAFLPDVKKIRRSRNIVRFESAESDIQTKLDRLTFFSHYFIENEWKPTYQQRLEKSANSRKGIRNIRYFGHGLHEYKGRFYPQLARSLMNIAAPKGNSVGLDPFCGSGTLLYEAALNDRYSIGLDLNPLAVMIANAKLLSLNISGLELERIRERICSVTMDSKRSEHVLNENYNKYLGEWFPKKTLEDLLRIDQKIVTFFSGESRILLRTILSDMLRPYSYQSPSEQRTRRRKDVPSTNIVSGFRDRVLTELGKIDNLRNVRLNTRASHGFSALLGDSRQIPIKDNSIDFVVTSPPYATALPYIDTDRLSLFFFNLINRGDLNGLGKTLIGNREIGKTERDKLEAEMRKPIEQQNVPMDVLELVNFIREINTTTDVGFRRKNLAALLFKYFNDMVKVCSEMRRVLKRGASLVIVIGDNSTIAGGSKLNIPTSRFVEKIALDVGFTLKHRIDFDPPPSYNIYSRNAIKNESILILERS